MQVVDSAWIRREFRYGAEQRKFGGRSGELNDLTDELQRNLFVRRIFLTASLSGDDDTPSVRSSFDGDVGSQQIESGRAMPGSCAISWAMEYRVAGSSLAKFAVIPSTELTGRRTILSPPWSDKGISTTGNCQTASTDPACSIPFRAIQSASRRSSTLCRVRYLPGETLADARSHSPAR